MYDDGQNRFDAVVLGDIKTTNAFMELFPNPLSYSFYGPLNGFPKDFSTEHPSADYNGPPYKVIKFNVDLFDFPSPSKATNEGVDLYKSVVIFVLDGSWNGDSIALLDTFEQDIRRMPLGRLISVFLVVCSPSENMVEGVMDQVVIRCGEHGWIAPFFLDSVTRKGLGKIKKAIGEAFLEKILPKPTIFLTDELDTEKRSCI
jgi:hypothetical protein